MGVAIIAGAVALLIGWHFSQAHMAHRAIPGRRSQLGPLRKDRTRHLIRVVRDDRGDRAGLHRDHPLIPAAGLEINALT